MTWRVNSTPSTTSELSSKPWPSGCEKSPEDSTALEFELSQLEMFLAGVFAGLISLGAILLCSWS